MLLERPPGTADEEIETAKAFIRRDQQVILNLTWDTPVMSPTR